MMRKSIPLFIAVVIALFSGCEKDDSSVTPVIPVTGTFTTESVKISPTYYSFASQSKVDSTQDWDIKLTTLYSPDDTSKSFKYPGIVLNRARNVSAKVVDGTSFDSLDVNSITGLATDPSDSEQVIGIKCFYYTGPPTHKLNPYDNRVFVIQTISGKRAKMKMLTYYNDAGASGYMKFQYKCK